MNGKVLFSVLIANYNNGKFIAEAINSVIAQTYHNWEIIIVDDCSTDNSLEILRDFIDNEIRIKLYKNDRNMGVSYTKQKLIDYAEGKICGFLDPDDKLSVDAVSKMVNAHQLNPNASLVYSNYYLCNSTLSRCYRKSKKSLEEGKTILDYIGKNDEYYPFHFSSFKKKIYEESARLNTQYKRAVDFDLFLKLEEVGNLVHIEDYLYYYRVHDSNVSMGVNSKYAIYWNIIVLKDAAIRRGLDDEFLAGKYLNESIFKGLIVNKIYLKNTVSFYKKKILTRLFEKKIDGRQK